MRPVSTDQDPLRFPLTHLLGTGSQVRLLRVLAEQVSGPISAPDAAQRAGLTEQGARQALGRLAKTGFVRRVGGGRSQLFEIRGGDLLTVQLKALFRSEAERHELILSRIRAAIQTVSEVRLAWVDAYPDRVGQPVHVAVVGSADSLTWVTDELRRLLGPIERDFEHTIEVHGFATADLPTVDWDEATVLVGVVPEDLPPSTPNPPLHRDRERRSLQMSEAIAKILRRDPSLSRRAATHLARLLREDPGTSPQDLREWESILTQYSLERLLSFIVARTSRAERLRQSSPFFAVLTPDERDEVLESMERKK